MTDQFPVVRCKFIVSSKLEMPYSDSVNLCWQVKMAAVWEGADAKGDNIAKENHIFSKATPSGELTMTISNPEAAAALKTGQCYYMDFTPAGLPAYARSKTIKINGQDNLCRDEISYAEICRCAGRPLESSVEYTVPSRSGAFTFNPKHPDQTIEVSDGMSFTVIHTGAA